MRCAFQKHLPKEVQTTQILNSDSAKALVRVSRYLDCLHEGQRCSTTLHSRCQMHMFFSSLSAMLNLFAVIPAVFCATVLLHRTNKYRTLRVGVQKYIQDTLHITHTAPPQKDKAINLSVLEMLEWCEGRIDEGQEYESEKSRRDRRRELLRLCPRSCLRSGGLEHFCPAGCCRSRQEAVETVTSAFAGGYLDIRPAVPALNKWTKLFQPVSWWAFGIIYGDIIPTAFKRLKPSSLSAMEDVEGILRLVGPDGVGLDVGRETYQVLESMRYNKALAWLQDKWTKLKVMVPTLVMKPSLRTMGRFFEDSSLAATTICSSVIPFVWHTSSPAADAVKAYAGLLMNEDAEYWLPVSASGWTPTTLRICSIAVLTMVGHIYLKCIHNFKAWPWALARLVHADVSEQAKQAVVEALFSLSDCCADVYTRHIRQWIMHLCGAKPDFDMFAATLRSELCLRRLLDDFMMCPNSNIKTEYRFSRSNRHNAAAAGRHPSASTLASDHVLSEFEVQHSLARRRLVCIT